jgi:hypothetical protein
MKIPTDPDSKPSPPAPKQIRPESVIHENPATLIDSDAIKRGDLQKLPDGLDGRIRLSWGAM